MNAAPGATPEGTRSLLYCSMGFFVVSMASMLASIGVLLKSSIDKAPPDLLAIRSVIGIGVLAALAGFALARAYRNGLIAKTENVLSAESKHLLGPALEKSADPIGDWTRLAGLVGGTGVFRKLEVSGMPLATILMTVLFSVLSLMVDPTMHTIGIAGNHEDLVKGFMDMAKLTLGAFIGSFVTKANARDTEASRLGGAAAAKEVIARLGPGGHDAEAAAPHHQSVPSARRQEPDNDLPKPNALPSYADRSPPPPPPPPGLAAARSWIGERVFDAYEVPLGTIKDLMFDIRSGNIEYAVMSRGGFLDLGEKLVAVPWQAFTLDSLNHHVKLNMDREKVAAAPSFDSEHWPNMNDLAWANQIHEYYRAGLAD